MNFRIKRVTEKRRIKLFANTTTTVNKGPAPNPNTADIKKQNAVSKVQLETQKLPIAQMRAQTAEKNVSAKQASIQGANMRSNNALAKDKLKLASRQMREKSLTMSRIANVTLANKAHSKGINTKITPAISGPTPSQLIKSVDKGISFNSILKHIKR